MFSKHTLATKILKEAKDQGITLAVAKPIDDTEYKYGIERGEKYHSVAAISMDDDDNYSVWCIKNKKEIFLNHPNKALHIRQGIWRKMKEFSSGSICLVLASQEYTEADYIREYQEFLNYIQHA